MEEWQGIICFIEFLYVMIWFACLCHIFTEIFYRKKLKSEIEKDML